MRRCYVCGKRIPFPRYYCVRCESFIENKNDKIERRVALRKAYDRQRDAFHCFWSGVVLEERDLDDPFHLCFDHYYPVRASKLVVSSELFNMMKCELGPDEFPLAIKELAAHLAGAPFHRDFIKFDYWKLEVPAPPEISASPGAGVCAVCGGVRAGRWRYCPRCLRFISFYGRDRAAHADAMRRAWSAEEGAFFCHFSENQPIQHW